MDCVVNGYGSLLGLRGTWLWKTLSILGVLKVQSHDFWSHVRKWERKRPNFLFAFQLHTNRTLRKQPNPIAELLESYRATHLIKRRRMNFSLPSLHRKTKRKVAKKGVCGNWCWKRTLWVVCLTKAS